MSILLQLSELGILANSVEPQRLFASILPNIEKPHRLACFRIDDALRGSGLIFVTIEHETSLEGTLRARVSAQ